MDDRGRVVIPEEIREAVGLSKGTDVSVSVEDGEIRIEPGRTPDDVLQRMDESIGPERSGPSGRTSEGPYRFDVGVLAARRRRFGTRRCRTSGTRFAGEVIGVAPHAAVFGAHER